MTIRFVLAFARRFEAASGDEKVAGLAAGLAAAVEAAVAVAGGADEKPARPPSGVRRIGADLRAVGSAAMARMPLSIRAWPRAASHRRGTPTATAESS